MATPLKPYEQNFVTSMDKLEVATDKSRRFISDLDTLVTQSTSENIQVCKDWILDHVGGNIGRLVALGACLKAVSEAAIGVTAAQKRRAVLLLVGDVLHAAKFHKSLPSAVHHLVRVAVPLLKSAVAVATTAPEAMKLQGLVNRWATSGCITQGQFDDLCLSYAEGLLAAQGGGPPWVRTYKLPTAHGIDNAAPQHLPASLMAEELLRRDDGPVALRYLRAQRMTHRRALPSVRAQLDRYFEKVDLVGRPTGENATGETEKYYLWHDRLGHLVAKDKATGEAKTPSNGYGWSLDFARQVFDDGEPSMVTKKRDEHRANQRTLPISEAGGRNRPNSSGSDRVGFDMTHRPTSRDSDRPSSRDYSDRYQDRRYSSHDDSTSYHSRSRYINDTHDRAHNEAERSNFRESGPRSRVNDEDDRTYSRGRGHTSYTQNRYTQSSQEYTQAPTQFNAPPPAYNASYSGGSYNQGPYNSGSYSSGPYNDSSSSNRSYNSGVQGNLYSQSGGDPSYGYHANNNIGYNHAGYNNATHINDGYNNGGYNGNGSYNDNGGYPSSNRGSRSGHAQGGNQSGYHSHGGNRNRNHGGHRRGNQSRYHPHARGGRNA